MRYTVVARLLLENTSCCQDLLTFIVVVGEMKLIHKSVIITSLIFALAGCATLEDVKEDISNRMEQRKAAKERTKGYPVISNTVWQGCAGGFTVGVVQAMAKDKRPEKVLRDGVIGAVIGCTIAQGLDRRRKNFATDADHFDAEIVDAQKQNENMQKLIVHTQSLTQDSRNTLAKLKAEQQSKQLEEELVTEAMTNARADLGWAKKELKKVQGNLKQRQAASELMVSKGDKKRSNAMNTEIKELQAYVNTLEQEVASLASINDSIGQLRA